MVASSCVSVLKASFCFRLQQFTLRPTCGCVYVCVYMLSQFRDLRTLAGLRKKGKGKKKRFCRVLYTPVSPSVPEVEGVYAPGGIPLGASFF